MRTFGRIIDIDLRSGFVNTEVFSEEQAILSLGGLGYNIDYLYSHLPPGTESLGEDNILIASLGLLTGTAAPSSSRVHLNALSPLSGLIGSSSIGGPLGAYLRSLDISGLIFRGTSPSPVYLIIVENGVRIEDAADLWGKDTLETAEVLTERHGGGRVEVLSIGRAGELMVRYACIMAGIDHAAGHTGLGAVMGSKRLKAIVVQGISKKERTSPEVMQVIKEYVRDIRGSVSRYEDYSTLGSSGDVKELNELGLLGANNYRSLGHAEADRIDGRNLKSYVTKNITCPRCVVHCKAEVEIEGGKYRGFRGGRPEYETVLDLGTLCGLTEPEALIYLSNLCNSLGLDTISTGSVIAFAMDIYDRGILTKEETGGIDLAWGNAGVMKRLMNLIADREGIGAVLAEGVYRAAKVIGRGAEKYAYHNKGVELYGSDPRGMMATALAYAVSMRGGDFTSVYPVPEFRYTAERAEREFGTRKAVDRFATGGKAEMVRYCMIVSAVIDSLGICKIPALTISGNFGLEKETKLVREITGLELDTHELLHIGERIVNMEKLFNLRFGATTEQDTLPVKFLNEPIENGPSEGAVVDLKPMVRDFYKCMGWDEDGVPFSNTLKALDIEHLF